MKIYRIRRVKQHECDAGIYYQYVYDKKTFFGWKSMEGFVIHDNDEDAIREFRRWTLGTTKDNTTIIDMFGRWN